MQNLSAFQLSLSHLYLLIRQYVNIARFCRPLFELDARKAFQFLHRPLDYSFLSFSKPVTEVDTGLENISLRLLGMDNVNGTPLIMSLTYQKVQLERSHLARFYPRGCSSLQPKPHGDQLKISISNIQMLSIICSARQFCVFLCFTNSCLNHCTYI